MDQCFGLVPDVRIGAGTGGFHELYALYAMHETRTSGCKIVKQGLPWCVIYERRATGTNQHRPYFYTAVFNTPRTTQSLRVMQSTRKDVLV